MTMSMSEMKQPSIIGNCCSSGDDGDGDFSDGDSDGDGGDGDGDGDHDGGDHDGKENDGGARYVDAFRLSHALHVFPIIKRMR